MGTLQNYLTSQEQAEKDREAKKAENEKKAAIEADSIMRDIDDLSAQMGRPYKTTLNGWRVNVADRNDGNRQIQIEITHDADPADPGFKYTITEQGKTDTLDADPFCKRVIDWLRSK